MSLTNLVKSAATLANLALNRVISFLLKEDGFYLLQETGDKLIIEGTNDMTNLTKTSA